LIKLAEKIEEGVTGLLTKAQEFVSEISNPSQIVNPEQSLDPLETGKAQSIKDLKPLRDEQLRNKMIMRRNPERVIPAITVEMPTTKKAIVPKRRH
jgi:hypothetical protein